GPVRLRGERAGRWSRLARRARVRARSDPPGVAPPEPSMSARGMSWLVGAIALLAIPMSASAQTDTDAAHEDGSLVGSSYAVDPRFVPSSEGFTFELRMGAYQPDLGAAFGATFGGDLG